MDHHPPKSQEFASTTLQMQKRMSELMGVPCQNASSHVVCITYIYIYNNVSIMYIYIEYMHMCKDSWT